MNGPSATSSCAPMADRLPELALGILAGAERAEVLDHLDRCSRCRAESAQWAATADVLPTVLAEAEPPAGFEARTLERLRADRSRVPRRPLLQRILAVAAVIAAVMIVTLAAVRIIDASSSSPTPGASAPTASARMVVPNGRRAGEVFMTMGNDRYVFLAVNYGVKSGLYRVESTDASNQVTPLGHVAITGGHGSWVGEVHGGATPTTVRLVDAKGAVWCTARFGPVAS